MIFLYPSLVLMKNHGNSTLKNKYLEKMIQKLRLIVTQKLMVSIFMNTDLLALLVDLLMEA
jgi:hypothetical protein